ncbi:hypothetical protein FUAX_01680 [Fulvitalea axinellae]|uniref:Uncharacterized protein n=1 Tax=Fulvitalea axinellae TaxID=1182444 RepID=A0AAU9D4K3_9BACT|nr:hypothetical protein FUAX_01680 [Fulvitalea axinellae]
MDTSMLWRMNTVITVVFMGIETVFGTFTFCSNRAERSNQVSLLIFFDI